MADPWERFSPTDEGPWGKFAPAQSPSPTPVTQKEAPGLQAATAPWEAAANLATGMGSSAVGGLAGLAQGAKNIVSPGMSAADRIQQIQQALTFQPRTEMGQKVAGIAQYPFEKLAQAGGYIGGKVLDATGSPVAATAADTATQFSPALVGAAVKPVVGAAMTRRQAALNQQKSLNAPRDAAIEWAKENDIVIDPASANPTLLNRWLQGFAGSAKTQHLGSTKNVPALNDIVRRTFGIDESTPLSPQALEGVRKIAGAEGYEPIRQIGDIKLDPAYFSALDKVEQTPVGASKSFKVPESPLQDAVRIARETKTPGAFDASAAVDLIKLFREKADSAMRQGEPALAKGYKQITKAVEDQIDRHLNDPAQYANPIAPETITKFREARQTIAKTYDVQDALKGNDIDIRVLAKKLKQGAPLSGDLRDMADFGGRFGGVARPSATSNGLNHPYVQGGWGDLGIGGLSGVGAMMAHGGAIAPTTTAGLAALGTVSRPMLRSLLMSRPYQSLQVGAPSYQPGMPLRLADFLANEEMSLPATAIAAGQRR